MSVWSKEGLNEFKRKVRQEKIYLDNDSGWDDTNKIKEILNNVLVWLSELEEEKGK